MTDELRTFRSAVRTFVRGDFVPRQDQWRKAGRPDDEAWRRAGDAGLLLSDLPAEHWGGGGTFAHEAVVVEELTLAGVHFASFIHDSIAHFILSYAGDRQRRNWLPRMARGELVGALAMSEPGAGSDLQGIRTTAVRDGDHYVVNGCKTFVTNGSHAGIVCLAVKTDAKAPGLTGITLLLVETNDLRGYRASPPMEKVGMRSQDTCELFFEDCRVPVANLLGAAEGRGFSQLLERMNYERLAISIAAVVTAERAVDLTTRHAKERLAFGKPLIDFQNTRFKLAECKTQAQVARVFLDDCIKHFAAGQLDEITPAMAKVWLTDCECRIVDECVQLHGGYGYLADHPIARMWTDSRVHRIYAGPNEVLKEVIAWSM